MTSPARLSPDQRTAAHGVLTALYRGDRIVTLTGYAGAGKTFLTGHILESLRSQGMIVAMAATTHKAAAVLSEKTGAAVATIHSLLGLRVKNERDGTQTLHPEGRPGIGKYQIIIIDEASMLGTAVYRHLAAFRDSVQVLAVGDPAQLPPVGESESPLFDSRVSTLVHLSGIVRQAADNPIIQLALGVRGATGRYPRQSLLDWVDGIHIHITTDPGKVLDDSAILGWRNQRVDQWNDDQHARHYPASSFRFTVGERVLFNDAFEMKNEVLIPNNSEGTVLAVSSGEHYGIPALRVSLTMDYGDILQGWIPAHHARYQAELDKLWQVWRAGEPGEDKRHASVRAWAFKKAFFPVRHTYASTVHKSQGSTHRVTFVDVDDLYACPDDATHNRLLYTAVTRPSDHLVFVTRS